jgi:hypothetical protein
MLKSQETTQFLPGQFVRATDQLVDPRTDSHPGQEPAPEYE